MTIGEKKKALNHFCVEFGDCEGNKKCVFYIDGMCSMVTRTDEDIERSYKYLIEHVEVEHESKDETPESKSNEDAIKKSMEQLSENAKIACKGIETAVTKAFAPGIKIHYDDEVAIGKIAIKDSGERREFETGAVRDISEGKGRCDLMPLDVICEYMYDDVLGIIEQFKIHGTDTFLFAALNTFRGHLKVDDFTMILEVSKHFEDGAKKYGEYNWQKGIPTHCYIDSAIRHYLKYLRGDKDEPHDRAFVWNILCCIWTCRHKPELNDYGQARE